MVWLGRCLVCRFVDCGCIVGIGWIVFVLLFGGFFGMYGWCWVDWSDMVVFGWWLVVLDCWSFCGSGYGRLLVILVVCSYLFLVWMFFGLDICWLVLLFSCCWCYWLRFVGELLVCCWCVVVWLVVWWWRLVCLGVYWWSVGFWLVRWFICCGCWSGLGVVWRVLVWLGWICIFWNYFCLLLVFGMLVCCWCVGIVVCCWWYNFCCSCVVNFLSGFSGFCWCCRLVLVVYWFLVCYLLGIGWRRVWVCCGGIVVWYCCWILVYLVCCCCSLFGCVVMGLLLGNCGCCCYCVFLLFGRCGWYFICFFGFIGFVVIWLVFLVVFLLLLCLVFGFVRSCYRLDVWLVFFIRLIGLCWWNVCSCLLSWCVGRCCSCCSLGWVVVYFCCVFWFVWWNSWSWFGGMYCSWVSCCLFSY